MSVAAKVSACRAAASLGAVMLTVTRPGTGGVVFLVAASSAGPLSVGPRWMWVVVEPLWGGGWVCRRGATAGHMVEGWGR